MTFGQPKCHTKQEALVFAGILAQHLAAEMTWADMEAWRNDPEGLEAVLAGLKSPPVSTGAQAPLHVASPRRQERADLLPVAVVDVGGGRVAAVTLLADVVFDKPARPMLPPLNTSRSDASVASARQNPHRKGAELPPDLVG